MQNGSFLSTRYEIQSSVLRAMRVAKQVSVNSLATACDVTTVTYRKWEDGSVKPTGRDLINIARLLDTYPKKFMSDPHQIMFKHMEEVVLTEIFRQIEEMDRGKATNIKTDDLIKIMEKIGVFEESEFSFEDAADLLNEAHNQVAELVP